MTMLRIGAHVGSDDPIAEAAARGADLVQIFLGDPQGWKDPVVAYAGGAAALRAAAEQAGIDLYVHAPVPAQRRHRRTTGSASPAASCWPSTRRRRPRSAPRG